MKKSILLAVSLILVLAILVAAVPAMAATTVKCANIYTVKPGDTRGTVEAATGMKWAEFAKLNNLGVNYKLIGGTKLCYDKAAKPAASFTAAVSGNNLKVASKAAADNQAYIVRAKDASKTGGWENLGKFNTFKTKASQAFFNIPKDLKGISPLDVCFKNAESGKLTCVKAVK